MARHKTATAGRVVAFGPHQIAETRYGPMMYNPRDTYVGGSIEAYGEFSPGETELLLSLIVADSVVMDVGANYGALTLPLARRARQVYAFEPQRPVFCALAATMVMNGLDNVICENVALGEKPGFITVPRLDFTTANNVGGLVLGHPGTGELGFYNVRAETLNEYVERNRIRRLDLLKIDVEGMEAEVLRGGAEAIRALRPVMYIEADRQEKVPALLECLAQLDYVHEPHAPPLFSPANYRGNPRNIWGRDIVSLNLLCRPVATAALS